MVECDFVSHAFSTCKCLVDSVKCPPASVGMTFIGQGNKGYLLISLIKFPKLKFEKLKFPCPPSDIMKLIRLLA